MGRAGGTACCTSSGSPAGSIAEGPVPRLEAPRSPPKEPTMADLSRITDDFTNRAERRAATGSPLRTFLWVALLITGAANATSSALGVTPMVGIGFGVLALGCVTGLVVHHYRT